MPHSSTDQPRPGKIVAVHLSYVSRAAQRGRRPKALSYFLKATSSLARGGGDVALPNGTELLAFEGEIALVIAKEARNVSVTEAWSHVGFVTAGNDFGLYDYKRADKGSNVRSKSRDGYTPLGPDYIVAAEVDPKCLRIRTWVNGELVQNDGSDEQSLLFSLAQCVADLSQHFTLEPGDVILTGTPAGSTVVSVGDVVDVEVDAPGTGLSSGVLRSVVVAEAATFDPSLGSLPSVDEQLRAEAYGEQPQTEGLTPQVRALLSTLPTAGLSAQLRARGLNNVSIDGVAPLKAGSSIVGEATTLRFVPNREDLFERAGGGFNAQKRVFDTVKPGAVIVIEARGESGSGTLGDVLALRASERGAAGVITDGGVRDSAQVQEILPVFAGARHPAVLGRKHVPWDADVVVACGNATVVPGDVIVGDDDGVVVIPKAIVAEIAQAAAAKEREDAWVAEQVKRGGSLDGLFPPTGQRKEEFHAWLASQPDPQ